MPLLQILVDGPDYSTGVVELRSSLSLNGACSGSVVQMREPSNRDYRRSISYSDWPQLGDNPDAATTYTRHLNRISRY